MKPIAITTCLAFAALSMYAAEPQATTAAPQRSETVLSAPHSVGVGDSPLVRAAKATNRLNKKPGQVITNETLVHAGGHFTTTTAEAQAQLPAVAAATPTMEQMAAEQRRTRTQAAAVAAKNARAQEQKKAAAARAAARSEEAPEALYSDPPALEGPITTIKPMTPETFGQPQTTTTQKPPM